MTPQDNAAPGLEECIENMKRWRVTFRANVPTPLLDASIAYLEQLQQLQRSPSRESHPTQARESERQGDETAGFGADEYDFGAAARGHGARGMFPPADSPLSVSGAEKADAGDTRRLMFVAHNYTRMNFWGRSDDEIRAAIDQAIKAEGRK